MVPVKKQKAQFLMRGNHSTISPSSFNYLILNKLNIITFFFFISLFVVSKTFIDPTAPTFYLSVSGSFLLAIITLIWKYKKQTLYLSVSEMLFAGFLLFGASYGQYMGCLSPKWVLSGLSLWAFYLFVIRTELISEWSFAGIVVLGLVEAFYGLGQYFHWFNNYVSDFRMSGSFGNPNGFASVLSATFPFALFLVVKREIYWRILGFLATIPIIAAITLSHSRAAIIALIVICILWQYHVFNLRWLRKWSKGVKLFAGSILMIAILAGLYILKKDSADGRLLIWQCTAKMVADKPLLGHGAGGFHREYMLYQADYFKKHPDSSYKILADIVKHPFNEFLFLLVEQGLVGGLFIGVFLFYLIREYRKHRSIERFYSMLCLIGIAAFASFSYTFCYPFVRLIILFAIAIIMKNEPSVLQIPRWSFYIIKPLLIVFCFFLLIVTGKMAFDEYRWNIIAYRSLGGETKKVMPDYERLYKTMNRNALFLYNYGAELNFIGETQKSNIILYETAQLYNDIDLQELLADNYQKMNQYEEAEKCLILASEMIPNRFIPLYRLFKLYKQTGKNEEAKNIAKIIVNKQIKIESPEVLYIKSEMEKELKSEL